MQECGLHRRSAASQQSVLLRCSPAFPFRIGFLKSVSTAAEAIELAEAGMADYLSGLEDYEDRLARGEIRA